MASMASLEASPLVQHDDDDDDTTNSWCGGCFRGFGFKRWRGSSDGDYGGERESWVVEKLRKVKEFSELIAGPKWKTFIRKISAYCNGKRSQNNNNNNRFNYDQHSYDLNFNNSDDDLDMPPSFSARFTLPRPQP